MCRTKQEQQSGTAAHHEVVFDDGVGIVIILVYLYVHQYHVLHVSDMYIQRCRHTPGSQSSYFYVSQVSR